MLKTKGNRGKSYSHSWSEMKKGKKILRYNLFIEFTTLTKLLTKNIRKNLLEISDVSENEDREKKYFESNKFLELAYREKETLQLQVMLKSTSTFHRSALKHNHKSKSRLQ